MSVQKSALEAGKTNMNSNDIPKKTKYFRDPIHGLIEVDPKARYVIDSRLFQRLRNIKQLAFTHLVYHGAEHSRFGHSLGVYHLAKILTEHLKVNDPEVSDSFCLAALLHDIGHFPFSHSFESVVTSYDKHLTHEKYSEALILHSEITDRLERIDVDPSSVVEFLKGGYLRKAEYAFLNNLLDAELDIDRLDFLLRDSYYCGVTYGEYDLNRLILSMKPHENEVVITEKGVYSVEIFVLARFYMYLQVYAHHTRRAFDLMLKSIFPKDTFETLGYPKPNEKEVYNVVEFDDNWLLGKIKEVAKTSANLRSSLGSQFLTRNPIRCVCECLAFSDVRAPGKRVMPAYTTLCNLSDEEARLEAANSCDIPKEEIWIDIPFKDLPFENRYRPFTYRGKSEKGIIKVWESETRKPKDIAELPGSLASFLASNMAQIVRIYTTQKQRVKLRNCLRKRYKNFRKEITWFPQL